MPLEDRIYYSVDTGWEPVPMWASFYLSLGAYVSSFPKLQTRIIVGLALPTRAYAASLVATGVVYGSTSASGKRIGAEERFRQLCALGSEASVKLLCGKRKLQGMLVGSRDMHGQTWLGVQVLSKQAGGGTHWISARDCLRIELADGETRELPHRQTGQLVVPVSSFAHQYLGDENTSDFNIHSKLECLVIGQINLLREEISQQQFACSAQAEKADSGPLLDVLRVRKFMSAGKAYRTDVIGSHGATLPEFASELAPPVVIFDGKAGFLKWRDYWRGSHWIVLLDRTEVGFEEAAGLLNTEYIQYRIAEQGLDQLGSIPDGIEAVAYQEALP